MNVLELSSLDHCWICKSRTSLHKHHIVPQCYGGVDGPLAVLCASCHNLIHAVADGYDMPSGLGEIPTKNIHFLVNAIKRARLATASSSNRNSTVTLVLTAAQTDRLDNLKRMLGYTSRTATMAGLIDQRFDAMTQHQSK